MSQKNDYAMFNLLHRLILWAPRHPAKGYYFLRNYKASHRDRVEEAIARAGLGDSILIHHVAVGPGGILPGKIAVFCRNQCPDVESLFFQHYALVREEAKARAVLHRQPRFS